MSEGPVGGERDGAVEYSQEQIAQLLARAREVALANGNEEAVLEAPIMVVPVWDVGGVTGALPRRAHDPLLGWHAAAPWVIGVWARGASPGDAIASLWAKVRAEGIRFTTPAGQFRLWLAVDDWLVTRELPA